MTAPRPNILVLMTDTLRPDFVPGYRRASDTAGLPGTLESRLGLGARTPSMDAFAAESTVFERAYAGSYPTVPNRNDLHTGRFTFPQRGWSPLPAELPSLAEAMNRAGYATQFFCDTPNQVPMGLQRGFQGWEWHRGQEGDRVLNDPRIKIEIEDLGCAPEKLRGNGVAYRQHLRNRAHWQSEEDHYAPRTLRSGIAWLQQHREAKTGRPFFLWLDTFDPHEPWDAPPYYTEWYDPGYDGEVLAHANYGRADYMTERERQHVKALYAAEISMVDKWFGRLLQQLDDLGYRDDTLVIHLSDHGHYFGDQGLQGKPFRELLWLYEGIIRTALTVRFPRSLAVPSRVDALAQPVDVTATVCDLAGVDLPGSQGRSLVPIAGGGRVHRDATFSSRYPILAGEVTPCAITTGEWSYQYWPGSPEKERLFDLRSDPGQQHDLRQDKPEIARDLRTTYLGWLAEQNPDMVTWLESVEKDPTYRPDSTALFRGTL
ncbi:MAG TPA: sulfatase [Chloroflexota bacterium]|nr:sulfatase [Chloroflexota bacterium]